MTGRAIGGARGTRWPSGALVMLAVVAVIGLATLAGLWAGNRANRPEPEAPPPPARVVRAGPAKLLVPGTWRSIPLERSGVAGLDPERAVAFSPTSRPSVRVVAEFGPVTDASLMPPALRAAFPGVTSSPTGVRVGGQHGAVYRDLHARGGSAAVSVLATTEGVLAIACQTPASMQGTGYDCMSELSAAAVPGATTLVPARSLALALRLPGVVEGLDPAAAAAFLRTVAGAAGEPLLTSLAGTRRAYGALQRAAANRWRSRFAAARRDIQVAEARLATALASVPSPRTAPPPQAPRAPAPAPATTSTPTPGGVSPAVFLLLALLAAGAGVAIGTAGAAPRLWRTATAGRVGRRV